MPTSSPWPTRYELKWAGWSLISVTFLWIIVGIIFSIISPDQYDRDVYTVRTDEDVVALHDALSTKNMRLYIEAIAAVYWLTFPLLLTAIYTLRKLYLSIFIDTKMEMWVYVMEKGYLLSLLVTNIIGPAIWYTLSSVVCLHIIYVLQMLIVTEHAHSVWSSCPLSGPCCMRMTAQCRYV